MPYRQRPRRSHSSRTNWSLIVPLAQAVNATALTSVSSGSLLAFSGLESCRSSMVRAISAAIVLSLLASGCVRGTARAPAPVPTETPRPAPAPVAKAPATTKGKTAPPVTRAPAPQAQVPKQASASKAQPPKQPAAPGAAAPPHRPPRPRRWTWTLSRRSSNKPRRSVCSRN